MTREIANIEVTISSGESLSTAAIAGYTKNSGGNVVPVNYRLHAIEMPATWTSAVLTFQTGTSYKNMYDGLGAEYYITPVAGGSVPVNPEAFKAVTHIKVRSGTAASPVNQAGDRTITLVFRRYE